MLLTAKARQGIYRTPGERWSALAVLLTLVGCASGPLKTPGPSVDGPPERPPADLVKVPDAQPRIEPIRQGGPNKPYQVLGQGYRPIAEDLPFKQRGIASWYGAKFHGRRTASGEVYSMYGMTAAHRTLPIPSYARVKELRTGKEIIVRINDRGPFHGNRALDLSYTAALKLGAVARGSVEVEIERLTFEDIRSGRWRSGDDNAPSEPPPTVLASSSAAPVMVATAAEADPILALAARLDQARPASEDPETSADAERPQVSAVVQRTPAFTPASKGFWVQLAAFRERQGVDAFQQRVARELEHLAPLLAVYQDGSVFRLQAGPYERRTEARDVAGRLREALRLEPIVMERR